MQVNVGNVYSHDINIKTQTVFQAPLHNLFCIRICKMHLIIQLVLFLFVCFKPLFAVWTIWGTQRSMGNPLCFTNKKVCVCVTKKEGARERHFRSFSTCKSVKWVEMSPSSGNKTPLRLPDKAFKSSRLRVYTERNPISFLLLQNKLMNDFCVEK